MQFVRTPDFTAQVAEALAGLRLWFLQIVAWIAEFAPLPRDARLWLQRQMIRIRSDIRFLIAAAVISRMRRVKRRRLPVHRRKMPRGFRWATRRAPAIRCITRGIRLRTLAQMRRVLDAFESAVDYALANASLPFRGGALVMTHAQEPAPVAFFIAPATEAADTS
ncbi:MAG: hypothetical protein JNM47_16390 [Hyphomonadaceae bacterium]|nr:hypothetical protein [Hyphomonadaceae bacterium]